MALPDRQSLLKALPRNRGAAASLAPTAERTASYLAAILYLSTVAATAGRLGAHYLLFPELAALSYGVFVRSEGPWARAPALLVITPSLTAVLGTLVTTRLAYGPPALIVTVAGGVLILRMLRSPITPAISAGVLPVVLNISSWWYPLAVLCSTAVLALLVYGRRRCFGAGGPPATAVITDKDVRLPGKGWPLAFGAALAISYAAVFLTGQRLILFPPLTVIAFEAFSNPARCPWNARPGALTIVCTLCAVSGNAGRLFVGTGFVPTFLIMAIGILILRGSRLLVPPALAVGIIPLILTKPDVWYPLDVALGTAIVASLGFFLVQERFPPSPHHKGRH